MSADHQLQRALRDLPTAGTALTREVLYAYARQGRLLHAHGSPVFMVRRNRIPLAIGVFPAPRTLGPEHGVLARHEYRTTRRTREDPDGEWWTPVEAPWINDPPATRKRFARRFGGSANDLIGLAAITDTGSQVWYLRDMRWFADLEALADELVPMCVEWKVVTPPRRQPRPKCSRCGCRGNTVKVRPEDGLPRCKRCYTLLVLQRRAGNWSGA